MATYDEELLQRPARILPKLRNRTGADTTAADPSGAVLRKLGASFRRGQMLAGADQSPAETARLAAAPAAANETPAAAPAPALAAPVRVAMPNIEPGTATPAGQVSRLTPQLPTIAGAPSGVQDVTRQVGLRSTSTSGPADQSAGSPIIAQYNRLQEQKANELALNRSALANQSLNRAAAIQELGGYATPGQVVAGRQAAATGNLLARADVLPTLASTERVARADVAGKTNAALIGLQGHKLSADASRYGADKGVESHKYTADASRDAAVAKVLGELRIKSPEIERANLENETIRNLGPQAGFRAVKGSQTTPSVRFNPASMEGEAAETDAQGNITYSTAAERTAKKTQQQNLVKAKTIQAQVAAGKLTPEAAKAQLKALGFTD